MKDSTKYNAALVKISGSHNMVGSKIFSHNKNETNIAVNNTKLAVSSNSSHKSHLTKKMISVTIAGILLTGCSNNGGTGSSGNNGGNGDASTLQIVASKTIYSGHSTAGIGYVVINNPTNMAVGNLHYNLSNLVGGATGAEIESASAANCAMVAAYSQCNIEIMVPAGAVAGSLGFNVGNSNSLPGQSIKTSTLPVQTIGVEQSAYNSLNGADGITLSYYNTVINGTPYILVSGLVASNNAGNFNKVVLVNDNGTEIANQMVISGTINNTQGSTFSILLPVPSGSNATQTIKVQTRQQASDDTVTAVSTATSSSTLTTASGIGIAEMLPSAVYLSATNPEQIITFSNIGDAAAQLQQLTSNNPNIEVVFNPSSLTSGAVTTAILKLRNTAVPATTGNVTLSYDNGQNETVVNGTVDQNVNLAPSPAPSPTPTPPPGPTPVPTPSPAAGLTVVFSPDNDFFTTTATGTVSRQLTLTNSGNTTENNIILTLPSNFAINAGSDPSTSCIVTGNSISNDLTTGIGCSVTVTYTNNAVTTQNSDKIDIAYNYNSGNPAPLAHAIVDYKVSQSTANLSITTTPASASYGSIVNNNIQTSSSIAYIVTNSGDEPATNLAFSFGGTDSSLFSYLTPAPAPAGNCISGGTLSSASGSNTCIINGNRTRFGPVANGTATGSKSANFNIGYTPYNGATATSTASININGVVTQAPKAGFSYTISNNTFTGGTGTAANPYTGYTNNAYTASITYTNHTSVTATGFTTSYNNLPAGWNMTTHGCNGVSMANYGSGTCTDIYTLNSAATGVTSINFANVTADWNDSSGTYSNQAMAGSTVYTLLTTPPVPTITIGSISGNTPTSVMGTTPIVFSATINGTSGVTSTLTATLANSVTGTIVSDPSLCTLTVGSTNSCSFSIIPWYTSFSNSTVGLANHDPFTPTDTTISLSATNGATISGVTGNVINYNVTTPYIYLPAPEEGAVSATNTGITWGSGGTVNTRFSPGTQQDGSTACQSGQEVEVDNLTGLMWVKMPTSTNYTWADAQTAPAIPASYCGYTDWRLPTINELISLINYAAGQSSDTNNNTPAKWLNNNGFSNVLDIYWSSTAYDTSNDNIWVIYFSTTYTIPADIISNTLHVWPVRGGQ